MRAPWRTSIEVIRVGSFWVAILPYVKQYWLAAQVANLILVTFRCDLLLQLAYHLKLNKNVLSLYNTQVFSNESRDPLYCEELPIYHFFYATNCIQKATWSIYKWDKGAWKIQSSRSRPTVLFLMSHSLFPQAIHSHSTYSYKPEEEGSGEWHSGM